MRRPIPRRPESGYTLIELIVSLTILATITGAITATFLTANNANADVSERIHESNDAQLTAGFWTADAQAAGGDNPATGSPDTGLGVFTSTAADSTCSLGGGTLVVGFKWKEWAGRTGAVDSYTTRIAEYVHRAGAAELERRTCADGAATGAVTLATRVAAAPAASCAPSACPANALGLPDTVTLQVDETTGYGFTLTAAVRTAAQSTPSGSSAAAAPLLALGSSVCSGGTATGMSVSGSTDVVVNGQAVVNAADVDGCTAVTANGGAGFSYAADGTSLTTGGTCTGNKCGQMALTNDSTAIGDPFASLPAPGGCGGGGSEPAAGQPGTYHNAANITGALAPGTYIFCSTVSFSGSITGTGVLLYFAGPSSAFNLSGNVDIDLTAPTTGTYAGMLMWNATTNPVTINGNGTIANYNGVLYSPDADVTVAGTSATYIGSIIAERIFFTGNHLTDITNGQVTPGAPNLTGVATSTTSTRGVDLTWVAPGYTGAVGNPITGYEYRVDTGAGYGAWTAIPGGAAVTSYPATCGTSNVAASTCTVQVRAVNAQGAGTASGAVSGSSAFDATAPRITAPAAGAAVTSTPTFTGTKWNGPGDGTNVTINVYGGACGVGGLERSFNATSAGQTWSAVSPSLSNGTKCAQASQVDFTGATVDGPTVSFGVGQVTNVALANGGTLGRADRGDTVTVQFAQSMTESTICTSWVGTGNQTINGNNQVTVTITDGGVGHDVLTASSTTCPQLNLGSIDLGSTAWVTASAQFRGNGGNRSTITYTAATNTLTITLGGLASGAVGSNVPASTVTYTPGAALRDAANNAIVGTYAFLNQRF